MSTIVRAVPSLSNAPVTVRLIVVPKPSRSEFARSDSPRDSGEPIKPPLTVAAAALAATLAAVATPPPLVPDVAPPPDGAEIVGIFGTDVETVGVLIVGTLTVGVEIFETFGKNGMAL